MYVLSRDGGGPTASHCTFAAPVRLPSTLCAALVGTESCVSTAAAVVSPGAVSVLPFSSKAFAPMLSPSVSVSPARTT